MKVLLDTNVVLDSLLKRNQWQNADKIFGAADNGDITIFITASSLTDIHFVAQSHIKKHTGQTNQKLVRRLLKQCFDKITILATNRPILWAAYLSKGYDFEDDIQIESARVNMLDFIVTSDRKGFRQSPVAVVSPADFVANHL